jgi:predicted ATPase
MIRAIVIESFKAFAGSPVPGGPPPIRLQPFTVLVGPNGSGKSTILQAIDTLGWLSNGTIKEMLDAHHWEYADLAHLRAERVQPSLAVEIELPDAPVVRWRLALGTRRTPGVASESIDKDEAGAWRNIIERSGRHFVQVPEKADVDVAKATLSLPSSWLSTIDLKEDRAHFPTLVALAQWARRIRAYYFLDPVALRAPSRGSGEKFDELGLHGENLASFLGRIKARPHDFARVVDRVRAHYPRLVDIHVRRKS